MTRERLLEIEALSRDLLEFEGSQAVDEARRDVQAVAELYLSRFRGVIAWASYTSDRGCRPSQRALPLRATTPTKCRLR